MSNTAGGSSGSRDRESTEYSTPNTRRKEPNLSLVTADEKKGSEHKNKKEDNNSSNSNSSNTPSIFTFNDDHINKGGNLTRDSPQRQLDSATENNKQRPDSVSSKSGVGSSTCPPHPVLGSNWANGRDKGLRVNLAAAHLNNMSTPVTTEGQWSTPSVPPHSPGALSWHGEAPTSSDKSSEALEQRGNRISRKESYKAQRQHYRREKQKVASALLSSLGDPTTLILADWLKVRGSLKSWTKLWCVLKPGLLLLYKSPKTKSNQWVGTVLLSACHVMERPSKKEGFCFKLYHPLEQGIWAPRGPHNEAIGAVVQPLPSSHLIFRAPSKAAGHCWLDGLELAQKCSNSLLRNSKVMDATTNHETQWSPEDMEKHFTQQVLKLNAVINELISDQTSLEVNFKSSPNLDEQYRDLKDLEESINKWTKIVDKFTDGDDFNKNFFLSEDETSEDEGLKVLKLKNFSDSTMSNKSDFLGTSSHFKSDEDVNKLSKRRHSAFTLDFFKKNHLYTSSIRSKIFKDKPSLNMGSRNSIRKSHMEKFSTLNEEIVEKVKRSFSDPFNSPITLPELKTEEGTPAKHSKQDSHSQTHNFFEENLLKIVSAFPKRRSSTPSAFFKVGAKEESIETKTNLLIHKFKQDHEKFSNNNQSCNEISISTDPGGKHRSFLSFNSSLYPSGRKSAEPRMNYSPFGIHLNEQLRRNDEGVELSSKTWTPTESHSRELTPEKFSLIKYDRLPSVNMEERRGKLNNDRHSHQGLYVAGKIVKDNMELSESDSDAGGGGPQEEEGAGHAPSAGEEQGNGEEQADGILAILKNVYVDELSDEIVQKGEMVEELAEENKSLLWYIVKQVRPGMDLSRVALPTFVLEPRSFLDKLSDSFYHADILARAVKERDAYTRMKTVVTWYLSGLYKKPKGLKKPYNPVLGEQFRCCWLHNNGTRTYYIAEQVSHHPPVSSFYVSNRKEGYTVQATILARSKFYGNSTSAILEGQAAIRLLDLGEVYLCTSPYAHCGGLLLGTLSMELGGRVSIHCPTTNYTADIEFKLKPFIGGSDSINMISGRIRYNKETLATLEGHWDGRIDIKDKRTQEESTLVDVSELKHNRLKRQLVTESRLGDLESQKLWIKVSEAIDREDQTAATEEKIKIEEAQRTRAREAVGRIWIPKHFTRDPLFREGEHQTYNFQYNHHNPMPWDDSIEVLEYEEDFMIKSLRRQPTTHQVQVEQSASETDSVGSRGAGVVVVRTRGMEGAPGGAEPAVAAALLRLEQSLGDHKNTLREVVNAIHRLEERERRMDSHTHASPAYTRSTLVALILGCILHWIYAWWSTPNST